MNFMFIDETGDPGGNTSDGASQYFGMSLVSLKDNDYDAIRFLLSQIHWLRGTAKSLELRRNYHKTLELLRGLKTLADKGVLSASSLYIDKADYGGRYLKWTEVAVPPGEWAYYLRNYLLRHLLEFHFEAFNHSHEPVDLVLDRVLLTEGQRSNTLDYLNSKTSIPLKKSFAIPHIEHLTICDSEYVGRLEIAHILADTLREIAAGRITSEV